MSLLYALEPKGVGTLWCEGLVSYLCRLANAHTVAVDDMVIGALSNVSDTDFRTWRHFSFWNRSTAISLFTKSRTLQLQSALYRATQVEELKQLSLASLANVIDLAGMAATEPRHCPACYRELPFPSAFRPLLWDIAVVTTCPQHLCALVPSRCKASPSLQQPRWSRRQVPGVCPTCGSLGYSCCMDLPSRMASCDEIWIANQTGALIAAVSAGRHFAADAVRRAVCQMAMIIGAGYPYRAAKVCGFSKARQFDWMNGTRLIKFKPLLVLCAAAGVDVVSAMQGHVWPGTGCNYRYVARSPNGTLTPFDERRQILLLAADRAECPSLSQVARELNVSTRTLRKAFPEETALIIARYLERVRSDRTMRALRTKEALEEIVERLHIDGRPVTARNVWLEGGIMVTPNSRFMSAFRQLLELDRAESRTGNDDTGCNDVVPK